MSKENPEQRKHSKTRGAESPEKSRELDADQLEGVSGGLQPVGGGVKRFVRIIGDPCDGGQ